MADLTDSVVIKGGDADVCSVPTRRYWTIDIAAADLATGTHTVRLSEFDSEVVCIGAGLQVLTACTNASGTTVGQVQGCQVQKDDLTMSDHVDLLASAVNLETASSSAQNADAAGTALLTARDAITETTEFWGLNFEAVVATAAATTALRVGVWADLVRLSDATYGTSREV